MKIDRKLNLVLPIEREDEVLYVHAMPISQDVFETYFLPISKTFTAIYSEGLSVIAGPRVAALMLKQVSQAIGVWDGPGGVQGGLMAEIRRLSNLVRPTDKGWETLPLYDAISREILSQDEISEVEGAVTFFSVVSAMHTRSDLKGILAGLERCWDASPTSSNATEFASSLKTSMPDDVSGETVTLSSIPS